MGSGGNGRARGLSSVSASSCMRSRVSCSPPDETPVDEGRNERIPQEVRCSLRGWFVDSPCCRIFRRKTRLFAENHVFHAKNAFIRRVVALFRRKTRFSDENRVHPACCRVHPPKITFFGRKTCSSAENRVFHAKNVFFRRKSRLSTEKRVHPCHLEETA